MNRLDEIIRECVGNVLLSESHGVSNDYLGDLVQFIMENLHSVKTYKFNEISYLFDKFPSNLKKMFEGCRLRMGAFDTMRNGQCKYEKRWKTIIVSVSPYTIMGERTKREMETTLYHELAHMIDYVVNNDRVGDAQTKVLSDYNNKFHKGQSKYKEFSHIMYGFTNLEMRGRLAAFKEKIRDLLSELKKDREFNTVVAKSGYNGAYKFFMREMKYSDAYRYAIGRYVEQYESYVKKCKYKDFGYRGVVEMANNLASVIGLKEKLDDKNPTPEEYETAHTLVVKYFDNLISDYKRKLATVALDCWYEFVDGIRNVSQNSAEGAKKFKNFMGSQKLF